MPRFDACLLDLDGTVDHHGEPIAGAARAAGCSAVAVRTGSFREPDLERHPADAVLDSIPDLPGRLRL